MSEPVKEDTMTTAMIQPITPEWREPITEPRVAAGTTATTIEELLEHFTAKYADADVTLGEDWATGQPSVFIEAEERNGYRAWIEE